MANAVQAGRGLGETCRQVGAELLVTTVVIAAITGIVSALVLIGAHTGILGDSIGLNGYLIYPLLGSIITTVSWRICSFCPSPERVARAARGVLTQAQQRLRDRFRRQREAQEQEALHQRLLALETGVRGALQRGA